MSNSSAVVVEGKKRGIGRILRPIRGQLTAAALLSAVGAMLTLVPLAGFAHIATKITLDTAMGISLTGEIWRVVAISLGSLFAGVIMVSAGELVAHLADNRITYHLRQAVAQRLARVPLGWFTAQSSGDVKQAMQDDIAILHSLTAHFYTAVGRALGAICISVVYMFALDWRMAIATLLPFIGFILFLRRAMKTGDASMTALAARMGQINSATVEFIGGIAEVKAFGAAGRAHKGFHEAVDGFARAFVSATRPLVTSMAHAHAMVAPVTVLGVVLVFGVLFINLGWIEPLDILPFVLVAPSICAPLLLLHTLLHDLSGATDAAKRVLALMETPVLESVPSSQYQHPRSYDVRFNDVSYGYSDGHAVLSNISFTLKPGTVTAIVGASGAGKSTLARMLLRFFDPDEGHITLGGVDLRCIETEKLYRYIGFVLQEVQLIHASVRDNLALGCPSASQQEIENATRIANIHERILALPRGYDSVIGEDAQLSGGERQRLCIARAILLDPPVLVLDEATASADAGNELAIQKALSHFAEGRSLMVIAHRLDTIKHADRILVLEDGRIAEEGTHPQLLDLKGRYADLWLKGNYECCQSSTPLEGASC
ncbi:ABC transporter ATP-binding protein [Oceanospirillum linum]|uniref:ABC transporter ATP-binding protein n=2 Tax=Oceanospirillum linum TaxID=966 RepID=A0A1T1HDS6_OCELI|nr:ABC transporter ATP-binding protein [Oceanospirillum linum]